MIGKKLFCFVLTVTFIMLSGCSMQSKTREPDNVTGKSFFEAAGIDSEAIKEIDLVYMDQAVSFSEEQKENFIQILSRSARFELEEAHVFKPSDYVVRFVTEDGAVDYTFYWFNGRRAVSELDDNNEQYGNDTVQAYVFCDNRFDVEINGTICYFRFADGDIWTEDNSWDLYNSRAKKEGLKQRYELDGYDQDCPYGLTFASINLSSDPDYMMILEDEETKNVVLAQYVGKAHNENTSKVDDQAYFMVLETLKGNIQVGHTIMIPVAAVNNPYYDDSYSLSLKPYYPSPVAPEYQKGEVYLLCLNDLQEYGGYQSSLSQYSQAILEGDTLFPTYNTEIHPFYNIPLSKIREALESK